MYPNQKLVRKRSPGNVIRELEEAKRKLPLMEHVKFCDDDIFIYTLDEIKDFCERYKKSIGLPMTFVGVTPLTLNRGKMALFTDAGLISIKMGIQTLSERTKKLYRRNYGTQHVEKAVSIIREFKDKIKLPGYDIILDNPWETDEDLVESLVSLAKLPTPYNLDLFSLTFYPETELYEKAKKDGIIIDDLRDCYRKFYQTCKPSYLNSLFLLLREYALIGYTISPKTMSLLTNKTLRKLKISWLLYNLLKIKIIPFKISRFVRRLFNEIVYVFNEGVTDIKKRDFSRIIRYIKKGSPRFVFFLLLAVKRAQL